MISQIAKYRIVGELGKGGSGRVVRGGSWNNSASFIRSANRSSEKPESRLNILGFRPAMDDKRP